MASDLAVIQFTTWSRTGKGTNRVHLTADESHTVCGLLIPHNAWMWVDEDWVDPCGSCRRLR